MGAAAQEAAAEAMGFGGSSVAGEGAEFKVINFSIHMHVFQGRAELSTICPPHIKAPSCFQLI